jgi:hypothetical protein
MADAMAAWMRVTLVVLGASAQLDLDCAAPERARVLIDYAQLSEIEHVEDVHREELDKALAGCASAAGRDRCRAERRRQADLDWDRKLAEIKAKYQKTHRDFEERCRASIVRSGETRAVSRSAGRARRPPLA